MGESRKKTLSYHRAEYFCEHPKTITLGMCIKQATDKLTTVSQRSIQRTGGYMMRLAHYKSDRAAKGHFLHITFETPGEHASIVPHVSNEASELAVATMAPPNYAEFMDGDALLYVNGNDVILCATATTIGGARYFLHALFEKAAIRSDSKDFDLLNAVDTQKFALIQKQGIKEIEMRASMYEASATYHLRKNHAAGVLGGVSKGIRALFSSPHDVSDDALRVGVTIKLDKRVRRGIALGHKRLEYIASDMIQNQQDADEYIIVLETGEIIKPKELVLRKFVEIDSIGKSVIRDHAWEALSLYYEELVGSGRLEQ